MTLGRHHKPLGSARTARALRALDLAGALHALWRAERRGAREKGVDQDRRTIRDWHHQRVLRCQRGLEWIWVLRNVSRTAREGTCPAGIESSSRRFDGGLQNGILAFRPPWYPTEPPRALRRATQARWVASARTTSGSIRVFRWMFRVDSSHTTKIALGRTRNSWGAPLSLAQVHWKFWTALYFQTNAYAAYPPAAASSTISSTTPPPCFLSFRPLRIGTRARRCLSSSSPFPSSAR